MQPWLDYSRDLMPPTAPPQLDDQAIAAAVPKSAKERGLGALGGVLAAGGGRDSSQSPLVQAMDKEHQQKVAIAQKHYKDFQTYGSILATGVDPDTGKPLDDAGTQKYTTLYNAASAELDKSAGVNKDVKGKLQRLRMLVDHVIKLHPKPGAASAGAGGGQTTGAGGGGAQSQVAPPPSPMDDVKQNAGVPRLQQEMEDNRQFNDWKKKQEAIKDFKIEEEKAKAKADAEAKAANPSTRAVMGPAISVGNARDLARQGKSFNDVDGNPIDLTSLPDSMGLKNVIHGGKSYYEPFSPNSKVITVGNETYAISPMDVEALPQGKGTDLGVHRTSTASSSAKGINADTGVTETHRTTTPQTPGVKGGASKPATPPTLGGAAPQKSASSSSSNLLPENATAKRVAPVREAMTQLFGDPTQPSLKSLADYGDIAEDPQASANVAKAVQLTLQRLGESEKKAGSLMTLLSNYGDVPQALMQSQVDLMKDVVGQLSPQESELYNTIISSISTVMGLRSLTSASAAKFSVEALERDVPIPGFNVFSKAAFNNKMSKLAENVYSGSRTVPLPKAERDFIKKQVERFATKLAASGKSSPAAPPKPRESNLDDEIKKAVEAARRKPAA